ncbi:MAG TPA: hypothetical protein PKV73_13560 [Agriterribacter sp.]|nr:hypothetical protein [Agriterribacter sp.]
MTLQNSLAQSLDEYIDRLYFGVLSRNPDIAIKSFIVKHAPVVLRQFDNGKWTAHSPYAFEDEPKLETVTKAFVFYSHPFFAGYFKSGQLEITQKIYNKPKWIDNITAIKLWFGFDNEKDAENAYKKLIDAFSGFNVLKRSASNDKIDKAEFTDSVLAPYKLDRFSKLFCY